MRMFDIMNNNEDKKDLVEDFHQTIYHSVSARRHRGDKPCEVCGKVDPLPDLKLIIGGKR